MGLKKVYWITLRTLVEKLCRYWQANQFKMPQDLPTNVRTALNALVLACDALIQYDNTHARGQ